MILGGWPPGKAGHCRLYILRVWRNWQTHMFKVHAGNHGGSSPSTRTKSARWFWYETIVLFVCRKTTCGFGNDMHLNVITPSGTLGMRSGNCISEQKELLTMSINDWFRYSLRSDTVPEESISSVMKWPLSRGIIQYLFTFLTPATFVHWQFLKRAWFNSSRHLATLLFVDWWPTG